MGYFKVLSVSEIIYRRMLGLLMNDELEKIGKETVLSQSPYKPDVCLEGLMKQEKHSVSMSGDTTEIQSRQRSKLSFETHRYTKPFGELISKCMNFGSAL
jgi:hypothetical protein